MFDRVHPPVSPTIPAPEPGLNELHCRPLRGSPRSVWLAPRTLVAPTPVFSLLAKTALCAEVRAHGFFHFDRLAEHVRALPFGRPRWANDPLAVLHEGRGTCSSKHRLLAEVAHACGHDEVGLGIGLYEMNAHNSPGVGPVLQAAGLDSIIDTRCHLTVGAHRFDFSGLGAGEASPFDALLAEHRVQPTELSVTNDRLLREALASWASTRGITPASARALREACVAAVVVAALAGASR